MSNWLRWIVVLWLGALSGSDALADELPDEVDDCNALWKKDGSGCKDLRGREGHCLWHPRRSPPQWAQTKCDKKDQCLHCTAKVLQGDAKALAASVETMLEEEEFDEARGALSYIESKTGTKKSDLARLYMQFGYHLAKAKKMGEAFDANDQAMRLDPNLLEAFFNDACYQSIDEKAAKSLAALNLVADKLTQANAGKDRWQKFRKMMAEDKDLAFVRKDPDFKKTAARFEAVKAAVLAPKAQPAPKPKVKAKPAPKKPTP